MSTIRINNGPAMAPKSSNTLVSDGVFVCILPPNYLLHKLLLRTRGAGAKSLPRVPIENGQWGCPPSWHSFWHVARLAAHVVGGGDALVTNHRAQAERRVDQYVAVEHPQAGVVGYEGHLPC